MAWLNELGVKAVAARTQDIDLARRQRLKLAIPLPFLGTIEATKLKFSPVPGMPSRSPPTSVKRPAADPLRIDVLTDGPALGRTVAIPELQWHAQTVPFYDYLLEQPHEAGVLAGGHCVPVKLPAPERLLWHKVYASANRSGAPEKAHKDLVQAATLAAILVEQDGASLGDSLKDAPGRLKSTARARRPALLKLLEAHPEAAAQLELAVRPGS
jgi:hypothetical protein